MAGPPGRIHAFPEHRQAGRTDRCRTARDLSRLLQPRRRQRPLGRLHPGRRPASASRRASSASRCSPSRSASWPRCRPPAGRSPASAPHAFRRVAAVVMPLPARCRSSRRRLPLLFVAALDFGAVARAFSTSSMNNEAARVETAERPAADVRRSTASSASAALRAPASARCWSASAPMPAGRRHCPCGLSLAAFLVRGWYLPAANRALALASASPCPRGRSLASAAIAFLAFGLEGAVADWSALFLVRARRTPPPRSPPAGYAAFSGAMAVMRFVGDRLVARLGRRRTLLAGGFGIAAGCTLALLVAVAARQCARLRPDGHRRRQCRPGHHQHRRPASPRQRRRLRGGDHRLFRDADLAASDRRPCPTLISLPIALWLIALAGLAVIALALRPRPAASVAARRRSRDAAG